METLPQDLLKRQGVLLLRVAVAAEPEDLEPTGLLPQPLDPAAAEEAAAPMTRPTGPAVPVSRVKFYLPTPL